MRQVTTRTLLTVGLTRPISATPTIDALAVTTGQRAIAAMRVLKFDLLLAGHAMPDMSVWTLMRRVRMGWPGQPWALVSEQATGDEEIRARALGALCVYDRVPSRLELSLLAESLTTRGVPAKRMDAAPLAETRAS